MSGDQGQVAVPIRFYCPFCDRLLGVSHRKAGAVIECPHCRGGVGVPAEETRSGTAPPPLPQAATTGLVISSVDVALAGVAVALLVVLAFVAGLLVGALT